MTTPSNPVDSQQAFPTTNIDKQLDQDETASVTLSGITLLSVHDMQFTTCTIRKPLFHHSRTSREVETCRLTNDMQFTICMTRKPLFHEPYNP